MTDARCGALFDAYVERHLNPLGALSANLAASNSKPSSETDVVAKAKAHINDLGSRSVPNTATSSAFKCLYLSHNSRKDLMALLKQHQHYVISLNSAKLPQAALQELSTMHHVLTASRKYGDVAYDALLEGVPSDKTSFPAALLISFNFFVIQAILQLTTSNLSSLLRNDSKLNISIFDSVARCFLSNSNLMVSITSSDPTLRSKYYSNAIKMVSGYLKVAEVLQKKLQNKSLKSHIQALTLKLAQLRFACGLEHEIDLSHYTAICLKPFVQDFCNETKSDPPGIEGTPVHNGTVADHGSGAPPKFNADNVSEFLSSLTRMSVHESCTAISSALDTFAPHNEDKLLHFSETIISFLKSTISESTGSDIAASTVIAKVRTLLKNSAQLTRLRQLARLSFEFGKCFSSIESMAQTAFIDLDCCCLTPQSDMIQRLKSRIEFCLARIIDLQHYDLASAIMDRYLEVFEIESTRDVPLSLLSNLITNNAQSMELVFSSRSKFPAHVRAAILEECCAQGFSTFNSVTLQKVFLKSPDLFSFSILHKFAEECHAFLNVKDIPPISSEKDYLLNCSILLSGLDSGCYSFETLQMVDHNLKACFSNRQCETSDEYISLAYGILEKLSHLGMYSVAIKYAKILLSFETISAFHRYKALLLLGHCYIEMGIYEHLPSLISKSGEALKKIHTNNRFCVNYNDVLEWKLLQLKYFIEVFDRTKYNVKIEEIKKILISRPEYNFSNEDHADLHTRLQSLLIISEFSKLVSDARMLSGNYLLALKHSKFSIKLLSSIERKLQSLRKNSVMDKKVQKSLLSAYQCSHKSARYLGLSKEALFYLDEVRSHTSKLSYIGAKQFWSFYLALNYKYANRTQKAVEEYEKGRAGLWDTPVLRAMQLISSIVLETEPLDDAELKERLETLLMHFSDSEQCYETCRSVFCVGSLTDFCADLEYFISAQLKGQTLMHVLPKNNSNWLMLLNALIVTRSELSNIELPESKRLPLVVPTCAPAVCVTSDQLKLSEKLVECKEILMRLIDGNHLSFLDIAQIHDVQCLLNRCVFLLSSFAILKNSGAKDLLQTLFYLKDTANFLPFQNQQQILETSNAMIPETGSDKKDTHFHDMKQAFYVDLRKYLPNDWVIVTLDVCRISGNLLLSRLDSQTEAPLVIQIPFNRKGTETSFESTLDEVKSIIAESNKSTKFGVTSSVKTKEDRKCWWKARFELDMRLERCLDVLDEEVIGGFRGIFTSLKKNDLAYNRFKIKLDHITSFLAPDHELSEHVTRLFYNLSPFKDGVFEESLLEDLLQFLSDRVSDAGFDKDLYAKRLPTMRHKMKELYQDVRDKVEHGHLILIPSFSCSSIPWESMSSLRGRSVSRMPSVSALIQALRLHEDMTVHKGSEEKVFFVVNPAKDLVKTQSRFEKTFSQLPGGLGMLGEEPSENFILNNVFNNDLFIYMGHGGGEQYVRSSSLMRARFQDKRKALPAALLMGCSSSAYQDNGRLQDTSNVFNWLVCGSPAVVTNLWDVTDKDIDTFSLNLLRSWGLLSDVSTGAVDLSKAMAASRDTCTLKYLNGAAPILHGLPLHIR